MAPFFPFGQRRRGVFLFTVLTLVAVVGCSTEARRNRGKDQRIPVSEKAQRVWPEPPEVARFIYDGELVALSSIQPKAKDSAGVAQQLMGKKTAPEAAYNRPMSLLARNGRIFVADPQGHAIVVFDIPKQRIIHFGSRKPNEVQRPRSLAMDDAGRVYVLDDSRRTVMVYDPLGLYLFSVGKSEQYSKPVSVAVSTDGQRIYVVDRGNQTGNDHRVLIYAPDGRLIQTLGPRGGGNGQFDLPVAAAVTPDGNLVILDAGNFRVQIFDPEGRFVRSFGSAGVGLGQFSRPRGLAIDAAGRIYVADGAFNNVQVFDSLGTLLMPIGRADLRPGPGRFGLVGALTVDETGRLYVADEYHMKIEVYQNVGPAAPKTGREL